MFHWILGIHWSAVLDGQGFDGDGVGVGASLEEADVDGDAGGAGLLRGLFGGGAVFGDLGLDGGADFGTVQEVGGGFDGGLADLSVAVHGVVVEFGEGGQGEGGEAALGLAADVSGLAAMLDADGAAFNRVEGAGQAGAS